MSEDVLGLAPKVAIARVRTRAQVVQSPVVSVHLGVGGIYSFEKNQNRTQMVCSVEAERWLVAG